MNRHVNIINNYEWIISWECMIKILPPSCNQVKIHWLTTYTPDISPRSYLFQSPWLLVCVRSISRVYPTLASIISCCMWLGQGPRQPSSSLAADHILPRWVRQPFSKWHIKNLRSFLGVSGTKLMKKIKSNKSINKRFVAAKLSGHGFKISDKHICRVPVVGHEALSTF